MASRLINELGRESKIDHIERLFKWWQTRDDIAKLNIAVEYSSHVHEFEALDLGQSQLTSEGGSAGNSRLARL